MQLERHRSLEGIDPGAWNALVGSFPFLRHEFLVALERHGALSRQFGWLPHYLIGRDDEGAIAAAAPTFLKGNSYGEFVFDFAWAHAYERHGLAYYPKLVAAAPFTPATGPRVLIAPDRDPGDTAQQLIEAVHAHAEELGVSSMHWLFPAASDLAHLRARDLIVRNDIQYHWTNPGYRDFDDFLDRMSSRKRKKLRRERRRVGDQGIELVRRRGDQMTSAEWALAHHFYASTFERKWNIPVLSRGFFEEVGTTMGEQFVVVLAYDGATAIGGAILAQGGDTLYGRYWGCDDTYHSLHFEACYYQGIEHAIEHGLARYEPGAQGEHKIPRGFLPTWTQSAHWIAHPGFREAIADHVARERTVLAEHFAELEALSPFKREDD